MPYLGLFKIREVNVLLFATGSYFGDVLPLCTYSVYSSGGIRKKNINTFSVKKKKQKQKQNKNNKNKNKTKKKTKQKKKKKKKKKTKKTPYPEL